MFQINRAKHSNIGSRIHWILLILLLVIYLILLFFCIEAPFFWDTVQLGAKHAYHYYESGLRLTFLPDEVNSGHIPAFGYYLASCWTLFGKNLLVSHLCMWPFVFMTIVYLWKLLDSWIADPLILFVSTLLCLLDPTVLAQLLLVSPDVVLICGLVIVLYGQRSSNGLLIVLGFLMLSVISIRGIYLGGLLGLWMLVQGTPLRQVLKYGLPAIFVVTVYYCLHYLQNGWIGVHDDSPWVASISVTSVNQMVKNIGVMVWRLLDFGRIVWIGLGVVLFMKFGNSSHKVQMRLYQRLLVILSIGYAILTIPFEGLTGHRYYLPLILVGLIIIGLIISRLHWSHFAKCGVMTGLIGIQILSNCIIYPSNISQGWDSSLAYLPYFELVEETEIYLKSQGIRCDDVGTYFPMRGNSKYKDLTDSGCIYPSATIGIQPYIIASNVMNDLKQKELSDLKVSYSLVRKWGEGRVYIELYQMNVQ